MFGVCVSFFRWLCRSNVQRLLLEYSAFSFCMHKTIDMDISIWITSKHEKTRPQIPTMYCNEWFWSKKERERERGSGKKSAFNDDDNGHTQIQIHWPGPRMKVLKIHSHMRSLWYIHFFMVFSLTVRLHGKLLDGSQIMKKKTSPTKNARPNGEATNVCTILINHNIWPNKPSTVIKQISHEHTDACEYIYKPLVRCEVFKHLSVWVSDVCCLVHGLCRDGSANVCNKWIFNGINENGEWRDLLTSWLLVHIASRWRSTGSVYCC